ncbi:MAG: HlyD family efflux transporter periplasmic adaptor subunit [Thermoguttaceae bacterium]|nr:HlyD family efflux transporter periplasmic adaptor subunit [Thermoguttaceae bacterium]MDW8077286.1 HlyD family efflux transporter periplasmic adaptor subunit [Thermoguttaceae bacterium]
MELVGSLLVVVALVGQTSGTGPSEGVGEKLQVPRCIVSLIDDVDVPARAEGILVGSVPLLDQNGEYLLKDGLPQYQPFRAQEGMEVKAGQPLALIEDREAWKSYQAARARLEGARMEAGNDISVRAAQKAWEVSCVEVRQAEEANRRAPGSVPYLEMNRLYLQRDQLELQKQKAEHDLNLAQVAVKIREAEADSAWLALQRHVIRSPVDGIIVEVHRDIGEWVKPGDSVLRIVRLDRVRVEGYLAVSEVHPAEVAGQPVEVRIASPLGSSGEAVAQGQYTFTGRIVFVNPLVEAGGRYLIWAEVENRQVEGQWILRPGLSADLIITRKRIGRLTSLPSRLPK